jgi:uncharacterized cupredoxin-like copper-binding protein
MTRRATAVAMLVVATFLVGTTAGTADTTTTTTTTTTTATGATTATTASAPRTINVSARSFRFTPSKLRLAKGESVTISLKSSDALHDFVVSGPGVNTTTVVKPTPPGATKRGRLDLVKPGTYQFFCSLPGHRAAGMRGTITVS